MYVHSVKLSNFKSIGDYNESEIILEPDVTAIIGKNESGKSNILDGLSRINFHGMNSCDFSDDVLNRYADANTQIQYMVVLKPTPEEQAQGILEDTTATFFNFGCNISGGLYDRFKELEICIKDYKSVLKEIGPNPFGLSGVQFKQYKMTLTSLKAENSVDLFSIEKAQKYLEQLIYDSKLETDDTLWLYSSHLRKCLNQLNSHFPIFYLRSNSTHLNHKYSSSEVKDELVNSETHSNSLLHDLVDLCRVTVDDFIAAAQPGSSPRQTTLRDSVKQRIRDFINRTFQTVYKTEWVYFDVDFNGGDVIFSVKTEDGLAMPLNERSYGFRWYLDLFIDALSRGSVLQGRPVVYLIDEPGASLHANAQKELLGIFARLARHENRQIVYTTHSPFMLDVSHDLHKMRAVVKDGLGYTKIYKTVYDPNIYPEGQKATLVPVINALGASLSTTFGPATNKLNVVLEGVSDYIYLSTMSKYLKIGEEELNFIPSTGATNSKLLCEILQGWKCPCIALFDYDEAGVNSGESLNKELLWEYKRQYCYIVDVSVEDIRSLTYKTNRKVIEDIITQTELNRCCMQYGIDENIGKTLKAKLVCEAISDGRFTPNKTAQGNFKELLGRLVSYYRIG